MVSKRFPVMVDWREEEFFQDAGLPQSVPWGLVEPHEKQANHNHGQDLGTLARRGGLCPEELLAVLTDSHWTERRGYTPEQVWDELSPLLEPTDGDEETLNV